MKNSINEFIKNLFREIFKSEEKTKFKIYILDVCVLCKLFDDQSYLRIRNGTEAVNFNTFKSNRKFISFNCFPCSY